MKAAKGLWLHVGLFGVATAVAFASASTKRDASEGRRVEAELWPGPASALRQISFESEDRTVNIQPAKDAVGQYAVVEVTQEPPKTPRADAGADLGSPKPRETKRFIAVDEADKLISAIAPAKSYRSLGRLEPARLVDYGLDKPDGKLAVKIGEKTFRLEIGSLTPGSGEHYVRDPESGLVHTFNSEVITKLKYSESRLLEHDLHGFNAADVRSVEVRANGKTRKVVRIEGKVDTWADAATPTVADETVGNWLLKIQRLRPQNYVEKPTNVANQALVRVEYLDKKGSTGYLELYRRTDAEKKYLARSERTRWYVEVPNSAAEPIEQDLATVVK